MKIKGVEYPIEWVNEDKSLEALEIIFNEEVTNGRPYRLSDEETDIIADIMRFCVPSLPDECFYKSRNGLIAIRLGATEILNFTFELLKVATEKKVIDIQDFLKRTDLTQEERTRLEISLENAQNNAQSLGEQIREMQLAYLESLPTAQAAQLEEQPVKQAQLPIDDRPANIKQRQQERQQRQRQRQKHQRKN
jgi:hypothetical protein